MQNENIPLILLESQEIEQVVVNLLSNARYAVDKKKQTENDSYSMKISLRLTYSQSKNQILLEVEDNGTGMSKEALEKCYDPFFTTKEVGEGTGLGLSITNTILKKLSAEITIKSILNKGTYIKIIFPVTG